MMRALWLVVLSACFSTPARPTGDGGVTDDASDPGDGNGDSGAPLAANVVFVTKGSISGNELSMAGIADARCRDAASVAGLLLTTEAMVAEKPEEKKPAAPAAPNYDDM